MIFKSLLASTRFVMTLAVVPGISGLLMSGSVLSADETGNEQPAQVQFMNVNVFDGRSDKLKTGMNIMIEDELTKI